MTESFSNNEVWDAGANLSGYGDPTIESSVIIDDGYGDADHSEANVINDGYGEPQLDRASPINDGFGDTTRY